MSRFTKLQARESSAKEERGTNVVVERMIKFNRFTQLFQDSLTQNSSCGRMELSRAVRATTKKYFWQSDPL